MLGEQSPTPKSMRGLLINSKLDGDDPDEDEDDMDETPMRQLIVPSTAEMRAHVKDLCDAAMQTLENREAPGGTIEALLQAYDEMLPASDAYVRERVMPVFIRSRDYEHFIDAKFPPIQRGERERRLSQKGRRKSLSIVQ